MDKEQKRCQHFKIKKVKMQNGYNSFIFNKYESRSGKNQKNCLIFYYVKNSITMAINPLKMNIPFS